MKLSRWLRIIATGMLIGVGLCFVLPGERVQAESVKRKGLKAKKKLKREKRFQEKKEYEFDETAKLVEGLKRTQAAVEDKPDLDLPEESKDDLDNLLEVKLDEEIELARRLLELERPCGEGPKVRFRLADLYWEKSKREFFRVNDVSLSKQAQELAQASMDNFQEKSIQNYKFITQQCPDYPKMARVYYELGKTLVEMGRAKKGVIYFKRIIDDYSDSEWIGNAWFMVGEYYFNTESHSELALKAYQRVRNYPDSSISLYAEFKEGWCYINMGKWDLAYNSFNSVLKSVNKSTELGPSERAAFQKAASKDLVHAYAHLDPRYSDRGIGGSQKAYALFRQLGSRAEAIEMMELLGSWYVNWDAHYDVIQIYRTLIKNRPQSIRTPIYRARIVYAQNQIGEFRSAIREMKKLGLCIKSTVERRDAAKANGGVDDNLVRDTRLSVELAEKTIRQIALEAHEVAKKLQGKAKRRKFAHVRELYENYLSIFSALKDELTFNYEFYMRFYFAEVLFQQGYFLQAARNYDVVVALNSNPESKHEREVWEAAAQEAVRAYDEHISLQEQKKPVKILGTKPRVIPVVKKELIAACERYINVVGGGGNEIVPIRYKVARVYYTYNHFEKAAPAFEDIVKNHPKSNVACYAANLALDIYNGTQQFAQLRDLAFRYVRNQDLACSSKERAVIRSVGEQAAFKVIELELDRNNNNAAAALAFSEYQQRFPEGSLADDAAFNAAVNFELSGKTTKANKMRKLLVSTYPESSLAPDTLFSMAANADRVLDFSEAAKQFELFARRYPKDKRSKDALFNAALYWDALGEVQLSLNSRRLFLERFPNAPVNAKIALSICEQMEFLISEGTQGTPQGNNLKAWKEAHNCYHDFIRTKKFTVSEPDSLCVAQHRRWEIMRRGTRYLAGALQIEKYLAKKWIKWKTKAAQMPRCSNIMARIEFERVEKEFKAFKARNLEKLDPTSSATIKRFRNSLKAKLKERDRLIANLQEIVDIGVDTWALAAVTRIGDAHFDLISKILTAEVPARLQLGDDELAAVKQELERQVVPVRAEAVKAFELALQYASEWGLVNKWSKRIRLKLHELQPEKYSEKVPKLVLALELNSPKSIVKSGASFKFKWRAAKDLAKWNEILLSFDDRATEDFPGLNDNLEKESSGEP